MAAKESACIIGLDFGTHSASIAVWNEENNLLEVLADDLGFRTIPCVVAFRGDESIVGQSAISQQHKNSSNTFDEVRSLLLNPEKVSVNVPVLEKEMTVEEINSIFFRNIHNQVKQQVGKVVRDAIVTVPAPLDEATAKRFVEAAQAGGIRIKSFIEDTQATLLAYGLENPALPASTVLVVDLGWSQCTVAAYSVSNGIFVPLAKSTMKENFTAKNFVKSLVDFCAKDFLRRFKADLKESSRAVVRLTRECENAMKSLSTGQEATIDIDSLYEGMDFSIKISRARFEDLLSIPIIHFKNLVNEVLSKAGLTTSSVSQVCLSGGASAMPKIGSVLKALLPRAHFPRVRFENCEAPCLGACFHGKNLFGQSLLDNAPTASPVVNALTQSILIGASADATQAVDLFVAPVPVPAFVELPITLPGAEGSVFFFLKPKEAADPIVTLGELVVSASADAPLSLKVSLSQETGLKAEVLKGADKEVVSTLDIAF